MRMTCRLLLLLPVAACSRPQHSTGSPVAPLAPLEQLSCIDSVAPRAQRRVASPTATALGAAPGTLVIRLQPLDSVKRNANAQVQLWGVNGASGGFFDSLGVATFEDKTPSSYYRLAVRSAETQPRAWSYVAPVRPGVVDTIWVDLGARCTQIRR